MKYSKISFLILFILVFGCTNKIVYVDKGKQLDPRHTPLTKKVVYKVQDEHKKNPITCLAIFPFEFDDKLKVTQQDRENLRKIFYAYIAPLTIHDVELSRLNYLKKKFPQDNFGDLTLRENCNSYFIGRIKTFKISSLGIYSENSIGGTFSIYNAKTNDLVWSASHIATSKKGKIPLGPIDIVIGIVEAAKNVSDEQKFRIIGDLARRISKTIPDYGLTSQEMFKEDEEIQFDKIAAATTKQIDTNYVKDFDKIIESNIGLDEKIDLIEPLVKELDDNKKLKYAEFLIENDRYENALEKLESLSGTSKEHYVFFLKSRAFAALQKYNQADKEIVKAIRLNKNNYRYYNVLGFINSKNDKLDRSLAAYKMAIEKNKDNAFAYFNTGIIYIILNYDEQAANFLYTAGLIYHKTGTQLDVMSVINQLKGMDTKPAKIKLKKLKKITKLKG
jgi:hypothetical protein